jgi:hypothetical protein
VGAIESVARCLGSFGGVWCPRLDAIRRRPAFTVTLTSASLHGEVSLASASVQDSYLVDSASSHMLVSRIKPCMSKYKQLYRETANGSLNQLSFI